MLRREIIEGSESLRFVLVNSGIEEILDKLASEQNKIDPTKLLKCYTFLIQAAERFTEVEKDLAKNFKIDPLFDYDFWGYLVKNEANPEVVERFHSAHEGTLYFLNHSDQVLYLLRRRYDSLLEGEEGEGEQNMKDDFAKLTVYLYEDKQVSTPGRLASMLEAVDGFYDIFYDLAGSEGEVLRVASCDSGRDKAFDFIGARNTIDEVKQLILNLWDKIVFYREDKSGRRLDLILQGLPILERLNYLLSEGRIGPEQAELLKRKITASVEQFVSSGAAIEEIPDQAIQEPRDLMQPEMKFLAPPSDFLDSIEPSPAFLPEKENKEHNGEDFDIPELSEDINLDYQTYLPERESEVPQEENLHQMSEQESSN